MKGQITDIELIRQVLHENDSRAYDLLMQRYSLQVYSAVLRLLKDEENAVEVTQMAFIQAYKQLDSWRGGNFGSWVTIIANHIGLRLLEKEKRRQKVPLDENADLPDETYNEEREQRLQHLEQAVSCLPEQDRTLIQWHYYEDIPLQTIAQRLRQTENNIKGTHVPHTRTTKKTNAIMTDQELDILFTESAKRQQSVNQINASVMRSVHRDLRLKIVRKWAKLLGLCFGVPLALVAYIFVLIEVISISSMQMQLRIACIALPLITIAVLYAINLKKFRLDM